MATRRSNKSHRVPNVKLRPVQPSSSSRRAPSPPPRTSSPPYGTEPECSFYDPCPRPFQGVVLCTTGVDKSLIFGKASELGATTSLDFTDRVTHLIASAHGGAKYHCALSRQIPIMKPEWITDSFDIWQRGDDVDFDESVEQHRLPIFSDVVLCLSGIEDLARRMEINRLVTAQQGSYVKVIERPVRVTHLLCSGDGENETDKMRYARKFNERGEANISLVWEEWFWDSLEFGGRFPEEAYKVDQPRPERKQPPPPKQPATLTTGSIAVPDSEPASAQHDAPLSSLPPVPAPPRNTANQDIDEEEIARAKRVPAVTLRVWESLLGSRGYVRVGGQLVRSTPSASPSPEKGKGKERQRIPEPEPADTSRRGRSALSTFTRTNSFAPARPDSAGAVRQPFRKQASLGTALAFGSQRGTSVEPVPAPAKLDDGSSGNGTGTLFLGLRFRARGEARCKSVRDAVEGGGGIWVEGGEDGSDDEDEDYVIVRLVSGSKLCRTEPSVSRQAKYRTECWLEGCLARGRICASDEHVTFLPLAQDAVAIQSGTAVVMSPSGLDMAEDVWVRRLTRALGITHAPIFSRASTHLLCPSAKGAKFERAQEWGTPVIDMGWLEEMARSGSIPDVGPHLVGGGQQGDPKGKGKEKQVVSSEDAAIFDITNVVDPPPLASQPKSMPIAQPIPLPSPKRSLASIIDVAAAVPQEEAAANPWGQPVLLLDKAQSRSNTQFCMTSPSGSRSPAKSASVSRAPSAQRSMVLPAPLPSGNGRVPSSTSPSPLKVPAGSSPAAVAAPSPKTRPSPLKPAVSSEEAVALQESITNLLGKRNSGDGADNSRKRPRHRSRPQSRHMSGDSGDSAALPIVQDDPAAYEDGLGSYAYSYTAEDNSILAAMRAEGQDEDESRMVTYEDPMQAQEKQRLLSLLGGRDGAKGKRKERESDESGGAPSLVRRSTRVAGF